MVRIIESFLESGTITDSPPPRKHQYKQSSYDFKLITSSLLQVKLEKYNASSWASMRLMEDSTGDAMVEQFW